MGVCMYKSLKTTVLDDLILSSLRMHYVFFIIPKECGIYVALFTEIGQKSLILDCHGSNNHATAN